MDRHDYAAAAAAAAAFAQQQAAAAQQQFGFQQYQGGPPPPSAQPFLPHHPSMQFPSTYHQQLHHHGHLPYQQHIPPPPPLAPSPPPIAPHILPPQPFFNPWDAPPPPVPPPADADLQKRIDKLAEYAAKNGPDFEKMIREKQQDNPAYNFLFGAEGHGYYRYKLWLCTRPITANFSHGMGSMNPGLTSMGSLNSPLQTLNPPLNPGLSSALNPALSNSLLGAAPPLHHSGPFPAFYDQHPQPPPQHSQPLYSQSRSDYEPMTRSFKGLSGPLPSDVAAELYNVLNNLTGTKESIKGAKTWFMQRSPFAPALAEALKDRVMALDDAEKQLHIIYLANDILFDSLQRRINPKELDNEALAFQPVLGNMLARIYHNPQNKDANQSRLQKILQFWASKEVYDTETIYSLEGDMLAGPPAPAGSVKESSVQEPSVGSSGILQSSTQNPPQWPLDLHRNSQPSAEQEQQDKAIPPVTTSQFFGSSTQFNSTASQIFATNTVSSMQYPSMAQSFHGSLPTPTPAASQLTPQAPNLSAARGGDQPPYPLFPPGLIPGMVRKMQIGSGVPYSPLSPLDIPTVIPPSTLSSSYILERVSKFFKEIGEVNPLENQSTLSDSIEDDEREQPSRTGGACIPPPPNLQVDADTGTLPDGSVEHKPGSTSTGRLGLGATADPNEMSQYDDVYSSYRKQRSSSYHTSMSARASAR